jgi:hypothetical protein
VHHNRARRLGDKEPPRLASRESLKSRPSRNCTLEQIVPFYAFAEQQAERDALRIRLQNAVQRLGPYEADSNFADPRLMASHMLNQLDRVNYQRHLRGAEGNKLFEYLYVPSEVEAKHFASMQAQAEEQAAETNFRVKPQDCWTSLRNSHRSLSRA